MQFISDFIKKIAIFLSAFLLACPPSIVLAGPQDGQVVAGEASINQSGPVTDIHQSSDRAVINWKTFDIGKGETVNHQMPRPESAGLHRVIGGQGASQLAGALNSNGNVYLVNPKGVVIHNGAKINTGGFVATTNDIQTQDFMRGDLDFAIRGEPEAAVINGGEISVRESGYAALVAPTVRNDGVIAGRLAKVALASGDGFKLDVYGDNLVNFNVSEEQAAGFYDLEGSQLGVSNTGRIEAEGGVVLLSARQLDQAVSGSINNTGVIEAGSAELDGGEIVFLGQGEVSNAGTLSANSGKGDAGSVSLTSEGSMKVSGTVEAKGAGQGGRIDISGQKETLVADASIAADGQDGGLVRLGGQFQGGRGEKSGQNWSDFEGRFGETPALAPTDNLKIDAASTITAGERGTVIAWSDGQTDIGSSIYGKFVETSGKTFGLVTAPVIASAGGLWLIDPNEIHIGNSYASPGTCSSFSGNIPVSFLSGCLSTDYTAILVQGTDGIIVDAGSSISWNKPNGLTLQSNDIKIENNVSFNNYAGGELNFVPFIYDNSTILDIGSGVTVSTGKFYFYNFGTINIGNNYTVNFTYLGENFTPSGFSISGDINSTSGAVITIGDYLTVNSDKEENDDGEYFTYELRGKSLNIGSNARIRTRFLTFEVDEIQIDQIDEFDFYSFSINPHNSGVPASFILTSGGSINGDTMSLTGPYSLIDFGINSNLTIGSFRISVQPTAASSTTIDFGNLYAAGKGFLVDVAANSSGLKSTVLFDDGSIIRQSSDFSISIEESLFSTPSSNSELIFKGKTSVDAKYINIAADRLIFSSQGSNELNYPTFNASRLLVAASYDQTHQVKLESINPLHPVFSAESVVITNGNYLLNPYAIKAKTFSWFDDVELYGRQLIAATKAPHIFNLQRLLLNDRIEMKDWPFEKNKVYISYGQKNYYNLYVVDKLIEEMRYKQLNNNLSYDELLNYSMQIFELQSGFNSVQMSQFRKAYEILTDKEALAKAVNLEVRQMIEALIKNGDIKFGSESIYQLFSDEISMTTFLEEYLTVYLTEQKAYDAFSSITRLLVTIEDEDIKNMWQNSIDEVYALYKEEKASYLDILKESMADSALNFVDALTIVWDTKEDVLNLMLPGGDFDDLKDLALYNLGVIIAPEGDQIFLPPFGPDEHLLTEINTYYNEIKTAISGFSTIIEAGKLATKEQSDSTLVKDIDSLLDTMKSVAKIADNINKLAEDSNVKFTKTLSDWLSLAATISEIANSMEDYIAVKQTISDINANPNLTHTNQNVTYIVKTVALNNLVDSIVSSAKKIADMVDSGNDIASAINIISKSLTNNNSLGRYAAEIQEDNKKYQSIWDNQSSGVLSNAMNNVIYSGLPIDLKPNYFDSPTYAGGYSGGGGGGGYSGGGSGGGGGSSWGGTDDDDTDGGVINIGGTF